MSLLDDFDEVAMRAPLPALPAPSGTPTEPEPDPAAGGSTIEDLSRAAAHAPPGGSCLLCGKVRPFAVWHAECLVGVCRACTTAARALPSEAGASPSETERRIRKQWTDASSGMTQMQFAIVASSPISPEALHKQADADIRTLLAEIDRLRSTPTERAVPKEGM